MPSNSTYVCVPCRTAKKGFSEYCASCNGPLVQMSRWSAPKKTNDRAWKRIESGDWLWNHRKSRGKRGEDTFTVFEYKKVPVEVPEHDCGHMCCSMFNRPYRIERIPGSGTQRINYNRLPDIDLGG